MAVAFQLMTQEEADGVFKKSTYKAKTAERVMKDFADALDKHFAGMKTRKVRVEFLGTGFCVAFIHGTHRIPLKSAAQNKIQADLALKEIQKMLRDNRMGGAFTDQVALAIEAEREAMMARRAKRASAAAA
jgi:hypothetical protein